MTDDQEKQVPEAKPNKVHKGVIALCTILLLLLLLLITFSIIVLTVFKPKQPKTEILSATVQGVAPRISFPVISVQLNVTLSLQLLVENQNHVSFKHGPGKTLLLYKDKQVGEADLPSGVLPSRDSTTLTSRLTLQIDKFASDLGVIVQDLLAGKIALETQTRIPGKINFLGIFKKHVVATLDCQITIGIPSMKVQYEKCRNGAKL